MKKVIVSTILLVFLSVALIAQEIGNNTAQQKLEEVSVSKMEDASLWYGFMSSDEGIIQLRAFEGSPMNKDPLEGEQSGMDDADENVLGSKISFYRRGINTFSIKAVRPLPIPGITKTISVWVSGRNVKHELVLEIADHFGNSAFVNMGKLNFVGWKKLTVAIPPSIKQRDYHYNDKMGITFKGFHIICDLDESYGKYYLYLDDLRAVTDLFALENRDEDDIADFW